jgi:hypothetical protein
MMSGTPLPTRWALNKLRNNKFYYKDASCWLFLLIHTTMHGSMNTKFINLTHRPFFETCYVKMLSIVAIIFIQWQMNQQARSTGWMILGGNTEALGQQPVPLPLCPPKTHMEWPVTQPQSQWWEANNCLSHGMDLIILLGLKLETSQVVAAYWCGWRCSRWRAGSIKMEAACSSKTLILSYKAS